jgi:sugar/nucleoside kinase (ribokinase family)
MTCAVRILISPYCQVRIRFILKIYTLRTATTGSRKYRRKRMLLERGSWTISTPLFYHLGPLLADDIPVELIRDLSGKGKVSLDVQGYLREVRGEDVFPVDWVQKKEALPYIHILKANETEMEKLTGESDVRASAKILADWGVKEVVITLGSKGSVIYAGGIFYDIPAFTPTAVVDATGCGDTYMAGYLYQRSKGNSIQDAGEFGAAMATLNIQSFGPFTGNESDIHELLAANTVKVFPG